MTKISIAQDKLLHCLGGAVIFNVSFPFIGMYALIPVLLAAIGKEIYDYCHQEKHTPDVLDGVATMVGGLLPAFPAAIMKYLS